MNVMTQSIEVRLIAGAIAQPDFDSDLWIPKIMTNFKKKPDLSYQHIALSNVFNVSQEINYLIRFFFHVEALH